MLPFLLFLPSLTLSALVHTPFGDVEGFEHRTENGVPTNIYLGIRYGKSTNGSSRFRKPEMTAKWSPTRVVAKEFGPSCISYTPWRVPGTNFSENCLFMNIVTPARRGTSLLPVFFYIHGGFYEVGSSTYLGYKRLAEKFSAEGIVVVTINYRLGPFGFFSLGDSAAAGNMGLWDQTLALKFAREILPSFGGDPARITVAGHSAGSSSASALQFSPHSSSLFSQAIMLSGSAMAEFAQSDRVVEESKKLLRSFGCPSSSTEEALDCLRKRDHEEIIAAVEKIGTTRRHPNVVTYNPRIDGEFFPHPPKLAKTAPKKRTLAGATDQESALFVMNGEKLGWLAGIALTRAEQAMFSRKDLLDFIDTVVTTDKEHNSSAAALRTVLVDFYAGNNSEQTDGTFYLQRYTDLNSDLQFLIPLYQETQLKLDNGWPTYLYILQHKSKSFPREGFAVKGMYHGDELEHFQDSFTLLPLKNEPADHAFGRNFVSAMVRFIKTGDPSSSSFSWPPVTKEHPFQHAAIDVKMSLKKEAYRADAAQLWLETIPRSVSSRAPGAEFRRCFVIGANVSRCFAN